MAVYLSKMAATMIGPSVYISFLVIVTMLQHRPFQNIKTDENEFKMIYEKECNILINPH